MPRHALRCQGLRCAGHRHIPTLRQHPRIEQQCLANGVFTWCLMNMTRDTEVRLIGFNKGAHTVTAHMRASVKAVNSRLIGWTMRYENFIACLFNHVIASVQIVSNLLLAELRRRIKWCIVRAPNPKDAHITEAMALAVQIDTALVEIMMDVPAIRIAHLRQHVRIIVHDGLQDLGGGFWATPAGHIPRD